MDALVAQQLVHHRRQAAGAEIFLAEKLAGRLHVDHERHVEAVFLPVLDVELDADVARDGVDVDRRVGRTADRGIGDDRVLERLAGENVGGLHVLPHHFDDAQPGLVGDLPALLVGRRDRRAAGQRHAERFGHRVHGRGGAHGVAVADRRRRGRDHVDVFLVIDLAGGEALARLPLHGTGAGALALVPAVQHRPAGEHDGGQVHRRRRHQAGGRRLVAAGQQHDAVERIAVEHLDEAEISEIAVKRGGRPFAGFLNRMHREFEGDGAGLADALTHTVGKVEVMAVAGREVRAGLGDADDGPAGLQFPAGKAVVQIALDIERAHARIVGIVEPKLGAQLRALAVCFLLARWNLGHRRLPGRRVTCPRPFLNRSNGLI